ncbi:MAG: hypothetical protein ABSE64_05750 [Vulcanimicrobiaceae bacterium]|jgi:hypothetical protein
MQFRDEITALESIAPSTIVVATARWARYSIEADGDPQLFLYDRRTFKIRARRLFGNRGFVNAIRSLDDQIIVSLDTCAVDVDPVHAILRFLHLDLSDASQETITLRGPATLAVLDTHLAIAERSCMYYEQGTLWDYDPQNKQMRRIYDGPHFVYQGDGS